METHIFNNLLHAVRKSAFTTVIKQYTHSTWSLEDVEKRRLKIREMIMPGDIVQCVPGEYELEPLIVDLIEEALLHGGRKGITENDLQLLIIVLLELLMKIKDNVERIEDSVKQILKRYLGLFTTHGLVTTAEYLSTTLIRNVHLYNYLLTEQQEVEKKMSTLAIYSIDEIPALCFGCSLEEWQKQQMLAEREEDFIKRKSEFSSLQQEILDKEKENVKDMYSGVMKKISSDNLTPESLKEVVDAVAENHTNSTMKELMLQVKEGEMNLEFEMDKVEILSPRKK